MEIEIEGPSKEKEEISKEGKSRLSVRVTNFEIQITEPTFEERNLLLSQFNASDKITSEPNKQQEVISFTPDCKENLLEKEKVSHLLSKFVSERDMSKEEEEEEKFGDLFFQRESSLKPPKTGKVIQVEPFLPERSEGKDVYSELVLPKMEEMKGDSIPLKVSWKNLVGSVWGVKKELQIMFNEPIAPLTSLEELEALRVPVKLEPAIDGSWSYHNTTTLSFHPNRRFPFSTTFTVSVDSSLTSASGSKMEKPEIWTFRTQGVSLIQLYFSTEGNFFSFTQILQSFLISLQKQ